MEDIKEHILSNKYKDIIIFFLFICIGLILQRNSVIGGAVEFNGIVVDSFTFKMLGYISYITGFLFVFKSVQGLIYFAFNYVQKFKYIEILNPLSHENPDECVIMIESDFGWLVSIESNYAGIVEMRCKNPTCAKDLSLVLSERNTLLNKKKYWCRNCGYKFTSPLNHIELANIYIRNYTYLPIDKDKIILEYEEFINSEYFYARQHGDTYTT